MEAKQVIFQELLNGARQYVVPLYQRTYSWEEKQWEQLWDDILDVYSMESPRNHFIGSVVTQQIHTAPEGLPVYTLVDGQQRMTTLFILLSVVREFAAGDREKWKKLADEIHNTCLINEYKDGDEYFKLMPTQGDRTPFRKTINGETPDSGAQIEKARQYFDKQVRSGDSEGGEFNLRKLHSCVVNHLDMVSIHLHTEDSPNRIFESLNNTGLPLSVADLIRNYVLMNIPDIEQQERTYKEDWYPMEQSFPAGQVTTDFFWRYLMMDGNLPRQDDTYEEIQKRFKDYDSPAKYRGAVEEFAKFSNYYVQIIGHEKTGLNESLLEQISRFNQWEAAVAYPFLMRSLDHVASSQITQDDLVEVMQQIESFPIRRQVCGVPTNSLRSIFARMSGQVDHDQFVESSKKHLLENRWPTDDDFRRQFVDFSLYSRGRLPRTRLILWSLEYSFNHKETPEQTDQITIEHIMPQTLSDEWKDYLGSEWSDIHTDWLDTVGNLTLSGYNPELGNKPYCEKQLLLLDSNFALSKSLEDFETWCPDSIQTRANELAEKALDIWKR